MVLICISLMALYIYLLCVRDVKLLIQELVDGTLAVMLESSCFIIMAEKEDIW